MHPKRYLLCGVGGRGFGMFGRPLRNDFPEAAQLAGLFDHNPTRLRNCAQMLGAPDLPQFTDFDRALRALDPDGVIVATRDCTHAAFICGALSNCILSEGISSYSSRSLQTYPDLLPFQKYVT